jgi:predicted transcriptional regulator
MKSIKIGAVTEYEDPETLAAIDEGLRDIEEGRVVAAEEVRKLIKKWISAAQEKRKKKRRRDDS